MSHDITQTKNLKWIKDISLPWNDIFDTRRWHQQVSYIQLCCWYEIFIYTDVYTNIIFVFGAAISTIFICTGRQWSAVGSHLKVRPPTWPDRECLLLFSWAGFKPFPADLVRSCVPIEMVADLLDQTENIYLFSHGQGSSHSQQNWSDQVFQ